MALHVSAQAALEAAFPICARMSRADVAAVVTPLVGTPASMFSNYPQNEDAPVRHDVILDGDAVIVRMDARCYWTD